MPPLPLLSCTEKPGGSVCPLVFCPSAATKLGEESALHYWKSCLPQAYGQQTPPQPGASWEISSPDPSSGPAPWSTGLQAQWPCHTPPHWMKRAFTGFQSHLSFTELGERGEGSTRGRQGALMGGQR